MITWSAYLTGAPDGKANLPLPVLSMTLNLQNAITSYHAITTMLFSEVLDEILLRPNGVVWVKRNGVDWTYFNQDSVSYAMGGRNASITLSGYRQRTYTGPSSWAIPTTDAIDERLQADGSTVLTLSLTRNILPADTVSFRSKSWLVKRVDIGIAASRNNPIMNITLE